MMSLVFISVNAVGCGTEFVDGKIKAQYDLMWSQYKGQQGYTNTDYDECIAQKNAVQMGVRNEMLKVGTDLLNSAYIGTEGRNAFSSTDLVARKKLQDARTIYVSVIQLTREKPQTVFFEGINNEIQITAQQHIDEINEYIDNPVTCAAPGDEAYWPDWVNKGDCPTLNAQEDDDIMRKEAKKSYIEKNGWWPAIVGAIILACIGFYIYKSTRPTLGGAALSGSAGGILGGILSGGIAGFGTAGILGALGGAYYALSTNGRRRIRALSRDIFYWIKSIDCAFARLPYSTDLIWNTMGSIQDINNLATRTTFETADQNMVLHCLDLPVGVGYTNIRDRLQEVLATLAESELTRLRTRMALNDQQEILFRQCRQLLEAIQVWNERAARAGGGANFPADGTAL